MSEALGASRGLPAMPATVRMPRDGGGPRVASVEITALLVGEGQAATAGYSGQSSDALPEIVAGLRDLQTQRRFCIKAQSRCDRSTESFIARTLGYSPTHDEKARAEIWKRAAQIRRQVENGGGHDSGARKRQVPVAPAVSASVALLILASAESRKTWDDRRKAVEREMCSLARKTPGEAFRAGVYGFGELGLAVIVGEAGDLSNYATIEKLWKRLGLAVIDGVRQQKRSDPDLAALHGYNPARRAEIWTFADSLLRAQWAGEKDGVPAHAKGPYGDAYARRKAATDGREWSAARRDADARRVMSKRWLRDLWRAWRSAVAADTAGA